MKQEPHKHELTIEPSYCGYKVTYGDQSSIVDGTWLLAWRLRLRSRAVIRRHDRESRKAGKRERAVARARVVVEAGKIESKWR